MMLSPSIQMSYNEWEARNESTIVLTLLLQNLVQTLMKMKTPFLLNFYVHLRHWVYHPESFT